MGGSSPFCSQLVLGVFGKGLLDSKESKSILDVDYVPTTAKYFTGIFLTLVSWVLLLPPLL